MKSICVRLSTSHGLALCTPLVLFWGTLACQGRLAVSTEPVELPDADPNTGLPLDPDAGIIPVPVELPDSGSSVTSSCTDGTRNGDESDIDCGGHCQPCAAEFSCAHHDDCQSHLCRAGLCVAASCSDGIQNGNETGTDCGGDCARCLSSTCSCANSAALSALSCDETQGEREAGRFFAANDGQTGLYSLCFRASGTNQIGNCQTFRWTLAAGLELLASDSVAVGLSADGRQMLYQEGSDMVFQDTVSKQAIPLPTGSILLSQDGSQVVSVGPVDGSAQLQRWTKAGGVVNLTALPGHPQGGDLTGLSPDASVIVGRYLDVDGTDEIPFRWTAADGALGLGTIPGLASGARPLAVSDDGSVVVGYTSERGYPVDLFRWTASDGMSVLGPGTPSPPASALFLSRDGAVVAGTAGAGDSIGVRWSFPGGANVVFPGGGGVADMSTDGAVIAGWNGGGAPTIWDVVNGTRRLQDIAATRGIDTRGWHFDEPISVAEDGSYVFGSGLCGTTRVVYRLVLSL
jgi:hypothetical protein